MGLGGSTGFEKNKANAPVWLSQKAHATVSIQLAQYAVQLLLQPTCVIVCVPSAFWLLVTELSSGFDKAVLREAEAAEHCHREAVTTFLHAAKNTALTRRMKSHPLAYTHFCRANRDASSLAKNLPLLALNCHITDSIKGVGRLIYAAFITAISTRRLKQCTRGFEYFTAGFLHVFAGMYIPNCDEDGYYRKVQCDQSRGECWCVDQHGGELMGSRIHGNPDCGMIWRSLKCTSQSLYIFKSPNVCLKFEPESLALLKTCLSGLQ